jgi:hypothetical protein
MPASRFAAWAGTHAESRVTEVTRVTLSPNPGISAPLDDAAEVTQRAEPRVTRVTKPTPPVEVTSVTRHLELGLPGKIQESHRSTPGDPGNPQNREELVSPKCVADPVWWRGLYGEKLAKYEAHPHAEAERLAYGELILQWHRWNGRRSPVWQCAGCDEPISGVAVLDLADGNRVHFDGRECLSRFGDRWRSDAVAALRALGFEPPKGCELL